MNPIHVVDSSVWIDAWRLYPPTVPVFMPIWEGIDALIEAGLLLSPDEVRFEVERGTDGLAPYLKKRSHLFHPLDGALQAAAAEVLVTYKLVDEDSDRNGADPFVVGLAKVKQAAVLCAERPAKKGSPRPRIPDACKGLNIPCLGWLEFLAAEPWANLST